MRTKSVFLSIVVIALLITTAKTLRSQNSPHSSLNAGDFAGWSLRLNVTCDGQSYDLLLEDTTDKSCGYAAVTDERGVIRQSKAIDCAI